MRSLDTSSMQLMVRNIVIANIYEALVKNVLLHYCSSNSQVPLHSIHYDWKHFLREQKGKKDNDGIPDIESIGIFEKLHIENISLQLFEPDSKGKDEVNDNDDSSDARDIDWWRHLVPSGS